MNLHCKHGWLDQCALSGEDSAVAGRQLWTVSDPALAIYFRDLTGSPELARNLLFRTTEEDVMLSLLGALWIFAVFALAAHFDANRPRREARGWRSRRAYAA